MDITQNEYFQFILKYSDKPWNWLEITKNSNITIDIVEANPNNIPWNWRGLSANPNITMVFAEATSVLPLIASDAYHKGEWKNRDRKNFTKIFE